MGLTQEKAVRIEGNTITVANPFKTGLIKNPIKIKSKRKIVMNPITKKLIASFNSVAGVRIMNEMNAKATKLYEKIPGLDLRIKKLRKEMISTAIEQELGDEKKEKYKKLESKLVDLERDKYISLTAVRSVRENQQKLKKEAVRQVTIMARKLVGPVIVELNKVLYRIEELKKEERFIRDAFTTSTGIAEGSSYGYIPPSFSLRIDPKAWRSSIKKYL